MSAMRPGEQGRGPVLYQVRRVAAARSPGGGTACGGRYGTTSSGRSDATCGGPSAPSRGAATAAGSPDPGPADGPCATAADRTTAHAPRAAGPAGVSAAARPGALCSPACGLCGGAGVRRAGQDQGRSLLDRSCHREHLRDTGIGEYLDVLGKRTRRRTLTLRLGLV